MFIYCSMQFAIDTQLRKLKAHPNSTHLILHRGRSIYAYMSLSTECSHIALFPVVVVRFADSMPVRPGQLLNFHTIISAESQRVSRLCLLFIQQNRIKTVNAFVLFY